MLNDRLEAARLIATHLTALEDAIDDALASGAALTSATPQARRRANISAVVGQDAIALTGEAMAALHAARAKAVAAHHAFAEVRDEMGLKTHASGDLWKIPKPSAELRVVGGTAA